MLTLDVSKKFITLLILVAEIRSLYIREAFERELLKGNKLVVKLTPSNAESNRL